MVNIRISLMVVVKIFLNLNIISQLIPHGLN